MVNGEQSWSQRMIGLPFTVYCLPHALRSALGTLRHGGRPKPGPLDTDPLLLFFCFLGPHTTEFPGNFPEAASGQFVIFEIAIEAMVKA